VKITAIVDEVVPIHSEISNAYISFREMTASAVAVHTDVVRDGKPVVGYGFNSNGRYAQRGILRDRVIPRLLAAPPAALRDDAGANFDPAKAWRVMMANEKPGGHGERSVAVGTIDMALWDLVAKIEGKPLYGLLADRYRGGAVDARVEVYAAGGYYYPEKGINGLLDELRAYLDLGYTTVKIKIGGASLTEDVARIEAVLRLLRGAQRLAVDANGRFDLDEAMRYRDALGGYPLKWYEEPCDPLDYEILARVAGGSRVPIATGENLFSLPDTRNLVRYGGMDPKRDFIQVDPALSCGLVEYLRILEMLEANGWSRRRCVPHGGNESYPGVFQPFGGFADDVPVENGLVGLPNAPGIGVERKANLWEVFRAL
jgi:L-alanine-DL-glutamate epimerase-like enolase superfamily enzyme